MPIDLYSPWNDPVETVVARHVGRERELAAIENLEERIAQAKALLTEDN